MDLDGQTSPWAWRDSLRLSYSCLFMRFLIDNIDVSRVAAVKPSAVLLLQQSGLLEFIERLIYCGSRLEPASIANILHTWITASALIGTTAEVCINQFSAGGDVQVENHIIAIEIS